MGHMTWGRISSGWISMSYVVLDKAESSDKNDTASSDKNTSTTQKVIATGVVKGTSTLRIRKGAGTSYAVAGYLKKGAKVEIYETKKVGSTTWGRVAKGWISMNYVKQDAAKEETTTQSQTTGTVKVSSALTIRKGAGKSYASVGKYKNGTKVTILQTKKVGSTTWGKTSKGWINMKYVVLDKTGTSDSGETAKNIKTITASCLRVRKSASTSAKITDYLYKGDKVEILQTKKVGSTTWGKISTGWISMAYAK